MTSRPPDDLDTLLEEIEAGARREAEGSGEFADPGGVDLVLWGAGRLGRKTLAGLRRLGRNVVAFVDTAAHLHGTRVDDVPVLSPEAAARRHRDALFVIAIWSPGTDRKHDRFRHEAASLGIARVEGFVALFRRHPEVFLPYLRIDRITSLAAASAAIRTSFGLLSDEVSRMEFVAQLRALRSPAEQQVAPPDSSPPPNYFPADLFRVRRDERFVDAGAFDGDTVRTLLSVTSGEVGRVWAFEPDPANYGRLLEWGESLPTDLRRRLAFRNVALSDFAGSVAFDASGSVESSLSADGGGTVPSSTLDAEIGEEEVTFVKMDIEAAEPDALRGGECVLRRCKPILAICAYHRQSHLWQIPLMLSGICGESRLFLRRYDNSPQDVVWGDVVCYAVPPGRLLPRTEK